MRKNLPTVLVVISLLAAGVVAPVLHAATYTLTVDGSQQKAPLPHFWSKCVGSGTMEYCLKPAWQQAAKIGAEEAGFEYVRGHGIFIHLNNDDQINVMSWNGQAGSAPTYNWSKIDAIYDAVLECGLKPIVEMSFMPRDLQTNTPASIPKNWDVWEDFCAAFVTHLEERYGVEEVRTWYFEVWNEYDYSGFWKNTEQEYHILYQRAAAGVKRVDSELPVGGPASTNSYPINAFLEYCRNNNVPVDFVSNHLYGGMSGDTADANNIRNDNRDRATIIKNSGRDLLSFNTEFSSNYSGQGGYEAAANCVSMDSHKNAPFVTKVIKLIIDDYVSGQYPLPDVLSYWAISDCFDESGVNNGNSYIEHMNGIPFAQVFGLINYQGIRKATFNAYRMLHMMGNTVLECTGGSGENDGIDGFVTLSEDSSQVAVLVYNYYFNLSNSGPEDNVALELTNLPFKQDQELTVQHYRIDETHTNPYGVWVRLGKEANPSPAHWDSLRAHEHLEEIEPQSTVHFDGSPISKSFAMPRWSVSMLTYTGEPVTAMDRNGRGIPRMRKPAFSLNGTLLTVEGALSGAVAVRVHDATGRLVSSSTTPGRTIEIGNGLADGMYVVSVETAGAYMIGKLLINR